MEFDFFIVDFVSIYAFLLIDRFDVIFKIFILTEGKLEWVNRYLYGGIIKSRRILFWQFILFARILNLIFCYIFNVYYYIKYENLGF